MPRENRIRAVMLKAEDKKTSKYLRKTLQSFWGQRKNPQRNEIRG